MRLRLKSSAGHLTTIALGFLFLLAWGGSAAAGTDAWRDKIQAGLLEEATTLETEFLVFLGEQADLSAAALMGTKLEKGRYVFETLSRTADLTQASLLNVLEGEGVPHRPYWVANMVWVKGDATLVERMAERADVRGVYANPIVQFEQPVAIEAGAPKVAGIEWNISQVNGPNVWAMGNTGQGTVVGGIDTGYDWDHPAVIDQYRGWDGVSADHNYNWHDAIHSGSGGSCGLDSAVPCDDHGHGTHTMGTMVGDDGGSNQIGLAPGAKWVGCRCMDVGFGTPARYTECLEWMIAPTDLNDMFPDPSKAPDVINNSWSCPPSEGCTDPLVMQTVVENVKAAGIVVVVSAGNSGSACSTVEDPIAIYEASFSVGATDDNDDIAGFSSRGPVTSDGSNRMKPQVSAPGVIVRSCVPGTGYTSLSGTSMAGPHVAAAAALVIAANPVLQGQVDNVESILEQTALARTTTQTCGGVPGTSIPNNTYGWGRIDALAAVNEAISQAVSVDGANAVPARYSLSAAMPNPFNPRTTIRFDIPERSDVSIRVFDVVGREVRPLISRTNLEAGRHSVDWNGLDSRGDDVPSGIYFYRMNAGEFQSTGRMVLVR